MIFALIGHGIIIVSLLSLISRWLDDEIVGDVCLYSLLVELFFGIFSLSLIHYTGAISFLSLGTLTETTLFVAISPILQFDELSSFFFSILDIALILCLYFLIEYFEYDSNSSSILLLSSTFSHLAIWFFCTFDLFLLVFFWECISFGVILVGAALIA